jgi:hypothetical protein
MLSLKKAEVPAFPGWWKALGPGIVWLALAQGSGELIWWPYTMAKYGLGFLFLLIPACLLQFPLNYEIGSYTLLTGESVFQGFIRLNRTFALALWILATISFLWFGAFASAGGTALAALTDFPRGWTERGQTLFWAYASMFLFLAAILTSRVIYGLIEKVMMLVSVITVAGLVAACSHPDVLAASGKFLKGLVVPEWPLARPWDPHDATKLLTAITFAGLGGFWTLFYSYWLREKGAGMAAHMGHVAGPITGRREVISDEGFTFEGAANLERLRPWKRFLAVDASIGIAGNLATTLMTCLLAYALLFPKGILPEKYEIAVVQARFFEASWGSAGRWVFLLVAACFLSDTWLTTLDAVSRMHSDFVLSFFPAAKKFGYTRCYYSFIALFTAVTAVTMLFEAPGPLILASAVVGFIGTVSFSFGLLFLNHRLLPKIVPREAAPGRAVFAAMLGAALTYGVLALLYFGAMLRGG